jgi:hypothetical protein
MRVELGGGFRNIGFDREVETIAVSLATNQIILDQREELEAPDSLNLGEFRTALVYDSSVFGPTSPILGRRYRFEVSQLVGSLGFTGVLADFRQYVMPVRPVTLAFRVLHYGRYGSGGDDPRLQPLFLGYPGLVRGYDYYSFEASECVSDGSSSCPAFDQLEGSRMALANVELRVPPFAAFGARNPYGPIPIELLAFADAGVAWTDDDEPNFLGGDRDAVRSFGFGARVNLLGFLVAEVDLVKPVDRERGWLWQFNFMGGF